MAILAQGRHMADAAKQFFLVNITLTFANQPFIIELNSTKCETMLESRRCRFDSARAFEVLVLPYTQTHTNS